MDMDLLHIIALKDNQIFDLKKRNEELMLDIKYLENRKDDLLVESGKRWTKLIKIQQILEEN